MKIENRKPFTIAVLIHLFLGVLFLFLMLQMKTDIIVLLFWCIPHITLAHLISSEKRVFIYVSLLFSLFYSYIFLLGRSESYNFQISAVMILSYGVLVWNYLTSEISRLVSRSEAIIITSVFLFSSYLFSIPIFSIHTSLKPVSDYVIFALFLFWDLILKFLLKHHYISNFGKLTAIQLATITHLIFLLTFLNFS